MPTVPTEPKYFNFPIVLLKDFLTASDKCLTDISHYALFVHSEQLNFGTPIERINSSAAFFNLTLGSAANVIKNGKSLLNSIDSKCPKVGINTDIYWDFRNNEKTDFEKASLLAFLAIKSILQDKPYIKIDNKFWLSRMAAFSKSMELEQLPTNILFYSNMYQTRKLKSELCINWKLVTYSRYTRGFYVSFKLTLEQLVLEAEKRRKSTKEKQLKNSTNAAVKKVLSELATK